MIDQCARYGILLFMVHVALPQKLGIKGLVVLVEL